MPLVFIRTIDKYPPAFNGDPAFIRTIGKYPRHLMETWHLLEDLRYYTVLLPCTAAVAAVAGFPWISPSYPKIVIGKHCGLL